MSDGAALSKIFDDLKPAAVIHFAGLKVVGESTAFLIGKKYGRRCFRRQQSGS